MNKFHFTVVIVAFTLGLCACKRDQPAGAVDAVHNSQNSLDWADTYIGEIPSASGTGIRVTLILSNDLTYELNYQYLERSDSTDNVRGTFKWNDDGCSIILDTETFPRYYQVAENRLIQLDMEGKPITGALADKYVLVKQR